MKDDPFDVTIVAPANDELTARKNAADAQTARDADTAESLAVNSVRSLARVKKISGMTVTLIIILIILAVGLGAYFVVNSVANNKQNQALEKSLQQMQD